MSGSGRHALILTLCAGIIGLSGCAKKGGDLNVQDPANEANAAGQEAVASGKLSDTDGKPCTSHKMCSPGSACVQDKCVRIDAIACTTDLDCPEFDKCNQGHCVGCASDKDCTKDFTCNSHGVCVPKHFGVPLCSSSMDCNNGEVCRDGMCQAFCTSSWGDCEDGATCISENNMLIGVCLNQNIISHSSMCGAEDCEYQCGEGKFLSNGVCYPENCRSDSDCDEEKYCADNTCKKKECESDDDCSEGVCRHFVCGCNTNADCSEEQYCDKGKCQDYQCETDDDCSFYDMVCHDRKCVGCRSDNDCEEGKHCREIYSYSSRSCGNHGCKFGGKSEKPDSVKCVECAADKDCPSERSHCDLMENVCVACMTDSDCQEGYECEIDHTCVKDENAQPRKQEQTCSVNADCGEGNYCSYEQKCSPMAKKCASDSDCEDGVSCNRHGYCSAKPIKFWGFPLPEICSTDEHCGRMGGSVCTARLRKVYDPVKGENINGHACGYVCTKSADCEKGETCIFGECALDYERHFCDATSDCPSGYECNTFYHECITPKKVDETMDMEKAMSLMNDMKKYFHVAKTPVECMQNIECKDGLVCLADGSCGCTTNEQCPDGNMCNAQLSCECISDSGCHPGFTCVEKKSSSMSSSRVCVCGSDDVCGENKICNMEGVCVDSNDVRETYARALDYHYGYVHVADLKKAVEYYQKSESLGNSFATIQLALIDFEKTKDAKKWNDKVKSALDTIDAQENSSDTSSDDPITSLFKSLLRNKSHINYLKAMLMIYGIGVNKDVNKGIQMLTEASEHYSVFARAELVDLYVSGNFVPKNLEKAKKVLEDSQGNYVNPESGYGYYRIAKILLKTPKLMGDKASEKFVEYLAQASSMGLLEAKYQISAFYGVNDLRRWDLDRDADSKKLLEYAKKMGHPEAAKRLEIVKTFSVEDGDSDASKDVLLKEAKQGNAVACYLLQKKYKDSKCAQALSKQGLLVGDYLMMLK